MKCTKCDTELREDAKFCDGCGSKVKIVYPDRTCAGCGRSWTPRKADPKYCPKCGYDLARDDMVVVYAQDMSGYAMNEATCVGLPGGEPCEVRTHLYMRVKFPGEREYRPRCIPCIMKYCTKMVLDDEWDELEAAMIEHASS